MVSALYSRHYLASLKHTINKYDYIKGERSIVDNMVIRDYLIYKDISASHYDSVHSRVFFEGTLKSYPDSIKVLGLKTKEISQLPYPDYSGYPIEFMISPHSKYLIFRYH